MDETELTRMMEEKFKIVYSERLGKNVHVIKTWVEEPVFKRHKKLFGYTDIGWTVRHPQDLIKALVEEGIWSLEKKMNITSEIYIRNYRLFTR